MHLVPRQHILKPRSIELHPVSGRGKCCGRRLFLHAVLRGQTVVCDERDVRPQIVPCRLLQRERRGVHAVQSRDVQGLCGVFPSLRHVSGKHPELRLWQHNVHHVPLHQGLWHLYQV